MDAAAIDDTYFPRRRYMARMIILFGLVLCGQTVTALFLSASKYPAEFLPMMIGIPALFFGVVSLNPHRRRRMAWSLALLSIIGISLSGVRTGMLTMRLFRDQPVDGLAYALAILMLLSCSALLLISYLTGRVSRQVGRANLSMIGPATKVTLASSEESSTSHAGPANVQIATPEHAEPPGSVRSSEAS